MNGECWLDRQIDIFDALNEDGVPQNPGDWNWLGISLDNKTALSICDYTDAEEKQSYIKLGINAVPKAQEIGVGVVETRYEGESVVDLSVVK